VELRVVWWGGESARVSGGEIEARVRSGGEGMGTEEVWMQTEEEKARSGAGSAGQGVCRVGGAMTPERGGEETMPQGQAGEAGRRQRQVG